MFTQVLGKVRLALAPAEPQWWHVPLFVTVSGLTTGPMPYERRVLQLDLDLTAHRMLARTEDGEQVGFALPGRSVAAFYRDTLATLRYLGADVPISPMPQEVPNPVPFPDDTNVNYDQEWVRRFHRVLSSADQVLKRHRAPFAGRHSPVHFFWGTFDLAYTRYSGRRVEIPPDAGVIRRGSMDSEEVCAGFWPGDERYPAPAFYTYAYPQPDGLEHAVARPGEAAWNADLGEFLLPYGDILAGGTLPEKAVLEFLTSTFDAAAELADWPEGTR